MCIKRQALEYAEILDIPFVFSSNGDGFLFHDRTGLSSKRETELPLNGFPSPETLWERYCASKNIANDKLPLVTQDYHTDISGKTPRYYQWISINRTLEAIAGGRDRILLVMATGTGKTYTAFQIIWRLWKARIKKRILFLVDRNILVDQTRTNDFKPFGSAMTKIRNRQLVLEKRTSLVAKKISQFLKATDRMAKTIVFCEDIDHAERMRQALVNENPDMTAVDSRYVMRMTGDSGEGKLELDKFIMPESEYPVMATTSRLLSTGVDVQTCKLIVLDPACVTGGFLTCTIEHVRKHYVKTVED